MLSVVITALSAAASGCGGNDGKTRLVFTSDSCVFFIEPSEADTAYTDCISRRLNVGRWDAERLGVSRKKLDHVDECKPLDDGRFLLTSSFGWAAVVDTADCSHPEFFASGCRNAHSADTIPGGLIAVACSDGGNQIRLYERRMPAVLLDTVGLRSAHGVVWMDSLRTLYAIGDSTMIMLRVTPDRKLRTKGSVTIPSRHAHDLSRIDNRRLCVAGRGAYVFDAVGQTWLPLPLFENSTQIKSVNYDAPTGRVWFTDATGTSARVKWRADGISFGRAGNKHPSRRLKLPGRTAYKVRVISW